MIGQFSGPYFTVRPAKIESCSFPARPINLGDIINILQTSDPRFFPLIYGPHALRLGHKSTGKTLKDNDICIEMLNETDLIFGKLEIKEDFILIDHILLLIF